MIRCKKGYIHEHFLVEPWAHAPFGDVAVGNVVKIIRNALLVSSASTGMLFAYYLLSNQADEISGLWVYAIVMFVGVFGYLLFAARKSRSRRRR